MHVCAHSPDYMTGCNPDFQHADSRSKGAWEPEYTYMYMKDSLCMVHRPLLGVHALGGKSSVIVFIITRRIVVCAIGWGKPVVLRLHSERSHYYFSVANYQPTGSGIVRLPFLAIVHTCACLRQSLAMNQEHDQAVSSHSDGKQQLHR